MRSAFDFAPFRRSTVGFDRLFDMLENSSPTQAGENYPPFDLIKVGDNQYRIELAVAGFKADEIDITAQQNVLIVSGGKNDEAQDRGNDYIYRGIANRSFERRFALADHIQVNGADLRDGLLSVELVREIPEAMKPKKISIGSGSEQRRERSAIGGDQPASRQAVDAEAQDDSEGALEALELYFESTNSTTEIRHLEVDPDLDPIREDARFKDMLAAAKQRLGMHAVAK